MPHFKATGPLSIQGAPSAQKDAQKKYSPDFKLKVVNKGKQHAHGTPGLVSSAELDEEIREHLDPSGFLGLASGSDCILTIRLDPSIPPGCIALDDAQQYNLHLAAGETYKFKIFHPPAGQPFDLVEVDAEARVLPASAGKAILEALEVEADTLSRILAKQCFGRVLAINEVVVVEIEDREVAVRITAVEILSEEEREESVGHHCFRGRLTPETTIYITSSSKQLAGGSHDPQSGIIKSSSDTEPSGAVAASAGSLGVDVGAGDEQRARDKAADSAASSRHAGSVGEAGSTHVDGQADGQPGLVLLNPRRREERPPPTNVCHVYTSDGEWFPVKKKVLRPCIALTQWVRSGEAVATRIDVDVDTLTFDRVLISLEALVLGTEPPTFGIHLLDDLLRASKVLGLRALQAYCEQRLGTAAAQQRVWRFQEVVDKNASGQCWLILDGMVLDVTRWLPEHPGGYSIIPAQALNMDCSRFFEIYHASRESFLYLKEFYMGEVDPADRDSIPTGNEPPSPDFLTQLREFTMFRMKVDELQPRAFKSF